MNQERFDELAQGLANNSLSRGQGLRSLAAGLLLAGPFAAFFASPALAQTVPCASQSCLDSAKQAYASCRKRCKRLSSSKKRKRCLARCNDTFANQTLNCGCATIKIDPVTEKPTPTTCADPCTAQTLSDRANQDASYSQLEGYLAGEGFVIDGDPKAFVVAQDGTTPKSFLITSYARPSSTGETAELYYWTEGSEDGEFAFVYEDGTVRDTLVVDPEGNVG